MTDVDPTEKLLVTAEEAAAPLSMTADELLEVAKAHDIAVFKVGERFLFDPRDVAHWVDSKQGFTLLRRELSAGTVHGANR